MRKSEKQLYIYYVDDLTTGKINVESFSVQSYDDFYAIRIEIAAKLSKQLEST